jgi:hypothetical protein
LSIDPDPSGNDISVLVHTCDDFSSSTSPKWAHLPLFDSVSSRIDVEAKLSSFKADKFSSHQLQPLDNFGAQPVFKRRARIVLFVSPRHYGVCWCFVVCLFLLGLKISGPRSLALAASEGSFTCSSVTDVALSGLIFYLPSARKSLEMA